MALDANGQPKQPSMPGMVTTMASSIPMQSAGGFGYKNAKDIYKMNDTERTDYWKSLRAHIDKGGYSGGGYEGESGEGPYIPRVANDKTSTDYIKSLSSDIQADFNGGYLTPEHRLKMLQQDEAKQFRADMPNLQREMGEGLKSQGNQALSAQNRATTQAMSSRGLLHSNINRGAQAGNRARVQGAVAQGTAEINQGIMGAADQMEAQAIQAGQNIQQNAQAMQNQIYSQAMARLNAQNAQAGGLMGLAEAGGMMAAFSDERLKTNIEPVSEEDLKELRTVVKPYLFNYINDEHGKGQWLGVMAQDLEKTKLGRRLVVEDSSGFKMIDLKKLSCVLLATLTRGI